MGAQFAPWVSTVTVLTISGVSQSASENHRWRTGPGEIRRCRDPELRAAGQPVRRAFRNGPHRPRAAVPWARQERHPHRTFAREAAPSAFRGRGRGGRFLAWPQHREGVRARQVSLAVAEWCREGRQVAGGRRAQLPPRTSKRLLIGRIHFLFGLGSLLQSSVILLRCTTHGWKRGRAVRA